MDPDLEGEQTTPVDVAALVARLVVPPHDQRTSATAYDPAVGRGNTLRAVATEVAKSSPQAQVSLYGQEINPFVAATAGDDIAITVANTLVDDQYRAQDFDFVVAQPPFGVDWRQVKEQVEAERASEPQGRYGSGLPATSDASLLFVQTAISKMGSDGRASLLLSASPMRRQGVTATYASGLCGKIYSKAS